MPRLVFNFLELDFFFLNMDNFLPFILKISLITVNHVFFFLSLEETKEVKIKGIYEEVTCKE